ncbi:MAG: PilZ domain-containing protein [Nitrospirae bacterium]|nr:PilZ domain-containing protein [Nitrospirota bacterium]
MASKNGKNYERRKQNTNVEFNDRRKTEQRGQEMVVSEDRRRLSSQVRSHEREVFKIPVSLQIEEKEIRGYTHDISPTGLLVICDMKLRIDTPITLQFSFGNVCNLNISGLIVSCRGNSIGIKFSEIREWEQKILDFAVKELKQNPYTKDQSVLNIIISQKKLDDTSKLEGKSKQSRRSSAHTSKFIGWGSFLPSNEILAKDINLRVNAKGYKNVGEVVEALTGIKSRRYADSDVYPSDLAALAAEEALKNAGMDPMDLDVIIFCGISKDFDEPATAVVVQDKIGAKNAYSFDLTNACNGFVSAIDLLDSLISSGRCENGIVVSGEKISIAIDWAPKTKKDFKLNIFSYTIGDAGGAAVMSRTKTGENRGIQGRWFSTESSYWRLALAGTLEGFNSHNKFFRSEGLDLEKAAIKCVPQGIEEITNQLGWSVSSIDMVFPHQIPVTLTENLYHKTLGIAPEKLFWTFPKYGNLATASMPVAVCEAIKANRVKPEDKILFLGVAAGFSIGIVGLRF